VSAANEIVGLWFTWKGELVADPSPFQISELQRGAPALPSQMYAYHSFISGIASVVLVDTVAGEPLTVALETAHRSERPPPQDGAVEVPAIGVLLDLHMRRYQFSPLLSVAVALQTVLVPEFVGEEVEDS